MNSLPSSNRIALLLLGLPLALVSALSAQIGEAAPVSIDRVPIHTASPDSGQDYGTWAAGRSYKASFHDAPTFVPYLGRAVDVDRFLSWRTEAVRVGGSSLKLHANPARRHDDYRYEYDYGGGIVEAYDVLPEGLEQTFVFANRPVLRGDLSVVGLVDVNLSCTARASASHGSLEFTEIDGTPRIRYGEAIAFDADGELVEVETAFDGDRITLTVPGTWLETARFPVTIDPLLSRVQIGSGTAVHESVDVSRSHRRSTLLTAYARLSSVTNWDLYVVLQGDGVVPGPAPQIVFSDLGAWNTPWCRVASSGEDYCVAFQRNLSTQGRRVRFHFHDADDYTMTSSVVTPATPLGFDDYLPDIGGIADRAFGRFLVVWQRDDQTDRSTSSVHGRFVSRPLVETGFVIAAGSSDVERPSVNQQTWDTEDYMVVYQRNPSGPAPWWCEGRLVSTGGTWGPVWTSSRNGSLAGDESVAFPQIAGSDGRFLVSTTISDTPALSSLGFGKEVVVERVNLVAPANTMQTSYVQSVIGPFAGNRVRIGGLAYDNESRSHWAMTSDENHDHGGNGSGTVRRFGFEGLEVASATIQTAGSSSVQAKSGGVTFGGPDGRFAIGWAVEDSSAARSWVWVNRWEYPDLARVVHYGGSRACSTGSPAWRGSRQVGSEFGGVVIRGAPPFRPAALLCSLQGAQLGLDLIGMTGCYLLVSTAPGDFITSINVTTDGNGYAKIGLPIFAQVSPLRIHVQWMHLAPGTNSFGVQSTSAMELPFGL